jgi:hypothetical protein
VPAKYSPREVPGTQYAFTRRVPAERVSSLDRLLRPIHRWIWRDTTRRVRKLLAFAEVETGGGRDILRAAEMTPDPLLRRLYLEHAIDELHHGHLFRERGAALLRMDTTAPSLRLSGNPLPGGHGLDDLHVEAEGDERVLAFLHVAEKAAAGRFAVYRDVVDDDPSTRAIFEKILKDEVFHMNYTYTQLARVAPGSYRKRVWGARATRLWKRYLRLALTAADTMGTILLTVQYVVILPPFAWLAKRAERREPAGWTPIRPGRARSATSTY